MVRVAESIFNWSEVWATLIPLLFLMFRQKQPASLKPVIVYLWLALVLNLTGDIIGDFKWIWHFPGWLQTNNPLYNIHSLVRFACFDYFFVSLRPHFFATFKKIIALVFVIYAVVNFTFLENFFYPGHLSGNLLSAEAYLLLVYCMLYYLGILNNDDDAPFKGPVFWIVTGLSVYVVVNFFVFLFYVPMIAQDPVLADNMWNVHNVVYIMLCLFITRGFYVTSRKYAATGN